MSHNEFLHFNREVVVFKKRLFLNIIFASIILCAVSLLTIKVFKPITVQAFSLKSLTTCITGSLDTDCLQKLPEIKNDIQDIKDKKDISWGDLRGIFKAMGILTINLVLIVMNTSANILKAILPFLK
jgi:hypothetical protein